MSNLRNWYFDRNAHSWHLTWLGVEVVAFVCLQPGGGWGDGGLSERGGKKFSGAGLQSER